KTPPFLRDTTARGVEILLDAPGALRSQLAAIMAAGADAELRILVPMVTGAGQLQAVRRALDAVLDGRRRPQLGAMIETPEAAQADSASNAAGASSPSALSRNTVPPVAPSARTARMLFASASLPLTATVTRDRKRIAVLTKLAAGRACRATVAGKATWISELA